MPGSQPGIFVPENPMIWLYDFPPPVQYDYPGSNSAIVLPLDKVRKTCKALGVRTHAKIYACSWGKPWRKGWPCTIILPEIDREITQSDQDMLHRVENANCNNWPRDGRE